jgi:hypothetical protein
MNIWTFLQTHVVSESLGAASIILAAGVALWTRERVKPQAAAPEMGPEMVDAISIYLGGTRDLTRLLELAEKHREQLGNAILRYQTMLSRRREELCALSLSLGYVDAWSQAARSGSIARRRKAWASLAAIAHHWPVRHRLGSLPNNALQDGDEAIRVDAARVLLAGDEPEILLLVFERALSDTPSARNAIAQDLGRHAVRLCEETIPRALRSRCVLEVLQLVISWERAVPLVDVRPASEHSDPLVRIELMRLMPFVPATDANRAALARGLADENPEVKSAARAAAARMRVDVAAAGEEERELVHQPGGGCDGQN